MPSGRCIENTEVAGPTWTSTADSGRGALMDRILASRLTSKVEAADSLACGCSVPAQSVPNEHNAICSIGLHYCTCQGGTGVSSSGLSKVEK